MFSTNASARQTFSRASFFPHGLVVVGGLRGELFVGICPAFISTFADHQRRALVHIFWLGQGIAILRRARARQSRWASSARLVAQTQVYVTSLQTVWGYPKKEAKTSKIIGLTAIFIVPTNWPYKSNSEISFPWVTKNDPSVSIKRPVVYKKWPVVLWKTTRRLKRHFSVFSVESRFHRFPPYSITPSRARVRAHYRSFRIFAVTSVTLSI